MNHAHTLLQLFSGCHDETILRRQVDKIADLMPDAALIGCATCGEIFEGKVFENRTLVSVSHFEKSSLQSTFVQNPNAYVCGKQLARQIIGPRTRCVIMFADGLELNGDELLRGFGAVAGPDILIAEGMVGDNLTFAGTFTIHDKNVFQGGVAGYGLNKKEQEIVFFASPLHDIGKVGIRDDVLLKPGRLSPEEFDHMKTHPQIGYEILKQCENPYLQAGAIIAYTHHEKFDGSGYPRGIGGEEIPAFGRITAVSDVFDALTSRHPYKKSLDVRAGTGLAQKREWQTF